MLIFCGGFLVRQKARIVILQYFRNSMKKSFDDLIPLMPSFQDNLVKWIIKSIELTKSEYDQEIPQSHTADKPTVP